MKKTIVALIVLLAAWQLAFAVEPGSVEFDPTHTSFEVPGGKFISQNVTDRVRFSPGVMFVKLSADVDMSTIAKGVYLGRIIDKHLSWVNRSEYAMALMEVDPPTVLIMLFDGWEREIDYAIRIDETVKNAQGLPLIVGGGTWVSTIETIRTDEDIMSLPSDVAEAVQDFKKHERAKKKRVAKASNSSGPCFPGGQNILWKGGWTDPVTGLMYFRGRWYDPRTASWLSPDPKGPIDSPNLYAGFAWQPQRFNDPMGTIVDVPNTMTGNAFGPLPPMAGELPNIPKLRTGIEAPSRALGGFLNDPVEYSVDSVTGTWASVKTIATTDPRITAHAFKQSVLAMDEETLGEAASYGALTFGLGALAAEVRTLATTTQFIKRTLNALRKLEKTVGLENGAIHYLAKTGPSGKIIPEKRSVNIGGGDETPDFTNVNVLTEYGPGAEQIDNLIKANAKQIGEIFEPGSVDFLTSSKLPPTAVQWDEFAKGAHKVMSEGGVLHMNLYAREAAHVTAAVDALTGAGFKGVKVVGDDVRTMLHATR